MDWWNGFVYILFTPYSLLLPRSLQERSTLKKAGIYWVVRYTDGPFVPTWQISFSPACRALNGVELCGQLKCSVAKGNDRVLARERHLWCRWTGSNWTIPFKKKVGRSRLSYYCVNFGRRVVRWNLGQKRTTAAAGYYVPKECQWRERENLSTLGEILIESVVPFWKDLLLFPKTHFFPPLEIAISCNTAKNLWHR